MKNIISKAKKFMAAATAFFVGVQSVVFATPSILYANAAQTEWDFSYESIGNSCEEWTCPKTGEYKFEVWGASGGGCTDANGYYSGGYTWATIDCFEGDKYYVYCGEAGRMAASTTSIAPRTYGDGGAGLPPYNAYDSNAGSYATGSGGGATSIRSTGGNITANYDKQIVTAGGGAGASSFSPTWKDMNKTKGNAGSASGLNSPTISRPNGQPVAGHTEYVETGHTTGGEGGGYYYSGLASNNTSYSGAGGNDSAIAYGGLGGVNPDKVNEYSTNSDVGGGNLGNGRAKITWSKPITSTLTLIVGVGEDGNPGTYDGVQGSTTDTTITITKEYGETITLDPSEKNKWIFAYWTDNADMKDVPTSILSGTTYTFGSEDTYYTAHYKYDGNATFYAFERKNNETGEIEHYIHVDNINDGIEKTVRFYASEDGGNNYVNVNSDGYAFDSATANMSYNSGTATYRVKATGFYRIVTRGGDGSSAYNNNSGYNSGTNRFARGGNAGTYLEGVAKLKYGDTLYIGVGGAASGTSAGGISSYGRGGNGTYNSGGGSKEKTYWGTYDPDTDFMDGDDICQWHGNWDGYYNGTGGAGGGATTIFRNKTMSKNRMIVAGGGGGGCELPCAYSIWNTKVEHPGEAYGWGDVPVTSGYGGNGGVADGAAGSPRKDRGNYGGGGAGWNGGAQYTAGTSGVMHNLFKNIRTNGAVSNATSYSYTGTMSRNLGNGGQGGYAQIQFQGTDTTVLAVDADFRIRPYDVLAPDAPIKPKYNSTPDKKLIIGWNDCEDHGNDYLYKAELWGIDPEEKLYDCEDRDNPGHLELSVNAISGTKGYFYIYTNKDLYPGQHDDGNLYVYTNVPYDMGADIKDASDTMVFDFDTITNGASIGSGISTNSALASQIVRYADYAHPKFETPFNDTDMYLYIVSVDHAGNFSTTTRIHIPVGYHVNVDPNGGEFRGTEEPTTVVIPIDTVGRIENPTRHGFEFIGWDVENMAADCAHYYDVSNAANEATRHELPAGTTNTTHEVFTADFESFLDLRKDAFEDVEFKAIWKDTKKPAVWDGEDPGPIDPGSPDEPTYGKYLNYDTFNTAWSTNSSTDVRNKYPNPDERLELDGLFETADGEPYEITYNSETGNWEGDWTNKSVFMKLQVYDGTGFSFANYAESVKDRYTLDRSKSDEGVYSFGYNAKSNYDLQTTVSDVISGGKTRSKLISGFTDIPEIGQASIGEVMQDDRSGSILTLEVHAMDTGEYHGYLEVTDCAGDAGFMPNNGNNYLVHSANNSRSAANGDAIITPIIRVDKLGPEVTMSYESDDDNYYVDRGGTGWTNGTIRVELNAADRHSGLATNAFSWDHGATWTDNPIKEFDENIIDYVLIRDAVGNWTQLYYRVSGIDHEAPSLDDLETNPKDPDELIDIDRIRHGSIKYLSDVFYDWQNKDIDVNFSTKDIPYSAYSASGIKNIAIYEASYNQSTGEYIKKSGEPLARVESTRVRVPSREMIEDADGNIVETQPANDNDEEILELSHVDKVQGITYYIVEIYDRARNLSTITLTAKLDKTPPVLDNIYVKNTELSDFAEDEILDVLRCADPTSDLYLKCVFRYGISDNHADRYGSMTSDTDSSGIAKANLRLINADDPSDFVDITTDPATTGLPGVTLGYSDAYPIHMTDEPDNPDRFTPGYLDLTLAVDLNTYETFPDWAAIQWELWFEDRAGNDSRDNDFDNDNIPDGLPYHNVDGEEIKNFSIKTVMYSDEDGGAGDAFNTPNTEGLHDNLPYFRTGEIGHTRTWTVGYVPDFETDFTEYDEHDNKMGTESSTEIKEDRVLKKYNMGDGSPEYRRLYKYNEAGEKVETGRPDVNGVPYASYFDSPGYWNFDNKYSEGTQLRIPPYYALTPDGTKRDDGRDNYQWEKHSYGAVALKYGKTKTGELGRQWKNTSTNSYWLWDTRTDEVHYRVTHET